MRKYNAKLGLLLVIAILMNISFTLAISDSNPSNNNLNFSVNVTATQSLSITFSPVDGPSDYESQRLLMAEFINKTYPISDAGFRMELGPTINSHVLERAEVGVVVLLHRLSKLAVLSGDNNRVVGIARDDWFKDGAFIGSTYGVHFPFIKGVLVEENFRRYSAAHEIGHTFSLCDEYSSFAWGVQNAFGACPNGDQDSDNSLDDACKPEGCSTETFGKLHPVSTSEELVAFNNFMGVGTDSEGWISKESYNHLLNKLNASSPRATTTLVISGFINLTSGVAKLDNSYLLDERDLTNPNDIISGNYTLELLDESDNVLYNLSFSPANITLFINGTPVESNISYFVFVANATGNFSKVALNAFNSSLNHSQSLLVKVKDIRVDNLTVLNDNNEIKIFGFILSNDWNSSLTSVNWTLNTGLQTITATDLTSLIPSEDLFVYVKYNYTSTGNFNVNATGINGTSQDSDVISVSVT